MADLAKQLKIKAGALRRNIKDVDFAHKEVAREQKRFDEEPSEDKKVLLRRVIDECAGMIPHNMKRVENTASDLEEFLAANEDELKVAMPAPEGAEAGSEHPDVAEAKKLLEAARDLQA
jgi:hypothetical protein